jgi:putative transposase
VEINPNSHRGRVADRPPTALINNSYFYPAMDFEFGLKHIRNSRMDIDEVYFWTDTIKDWKHLLKHDKYKQLVIDNLRDLVQKKMIVIYGFVIMPNHLHLIWELKSKNGKEMPHASFNKATAHLIVNDLKEYHSNVLPYFEVKEKDRNFRIWQRDPLAVLMDSREKLEQKLNYIHNNPLNERWNLSERPEDYYWSSAKFYETNQDDFGFITSYADRI